GAERYLKSAEVLPDSVLAELPSQDAVLMGAVGDPRVPPGVLEIGLLLALRQALDLYVNLRPSRLFEGVPSALAPATPADLARPTAYQHVGAAALLLVTQPRRFQVIVTDNLFGDILSDLAAGLVGGIGFVGSGNIHPGALSIFEPVHGSAPDIAGTGRANPIGAVLSAALMLRHLGEEGGAAGMEAAVAAVAGKVAGSAAGTRQIGEMISEAAA